ncbi:MAG: hypothetical protein HFE49_07065 [Clostridia bacterium]|nr:hypothetical protein [Clostridia bacterium]
MADAMDTLKNILGDDAEDKIRNVMGSLSASSDSSDTGFNADGLNQVMQLKNIVDSMTNNRNDPRTNLLMSLKPYMRSGRQRSIDSAVKLLGLTNLTKILRK